MSRVRGRPFEAGNKFGRGRPRGSGNKISAAAQELFTDHSVALTRKCLVMALQGDKTMMQISMDRAVPVRRDQPVKIGSLPMGTAAEIAKASETIAQKVAAGRITVQQGLGFAGLIETRRRAIETQELAERLSRLEQKFSGETRP